MKKLLTAAIMAVLLLCLAFNAYAGGGQEKVLVKEGTVSLWTGWALLAEVFDQVKSDYEGENPEVNLEIAHFNLREFEQKLAISVPAGQGPDIFIASEFIMPQYVEAGFVAKPPKEVVDFVESKYDSLVRAVNMYTAPGDKKAQIYGVPHIGIARVMYYNKKIFRESGLPDRSPDTWDELFSFGEKAAEWDAGGVLTRGGISLRLFGGGSGVTEKYNIKLVQSGGSILGKTPDGKWKANYDNQAGIDALNFYLDVIYKSKIDSFEIKHDAQAFMNEQTAMFQRELWPTPMFKANAPNLEFGTSVMPKYKNRGTVYSTESAFVPTSSANPLLAWDVITYFNQPKYLKAWFKTQGWVPPQIEIDYSDIFAEMPEYKAAFDFPEGYLLTLYPPITPIDEINTKFGERLEKAFKNPSLVGNTTAIKRFLDEAAAETNKILQNNGLLGEGNVEKGNWIEAPKDLGYKF
jgi:multiple sugar transport system substrate-binding protein